jgi:5'-methylthioadenosine phosphorylase
MVLETIHIRARKGEVAERVVVSGDPARVRLLATFLEDSRLVNDVRGYLVYTGKYKGVPVSVAVHGIGSPSAALVIEELAMLGARIIVRLGTCGAMVPELDVGDVVVATGASYYSGGIFTQYIGEPVCQTAVPDFKLMVKIAGKLGEQGVKHMFGPVVSCDAFYTEEGFVEKWVRRGMLAVDMETATLYILGQLKKLSTASVLLVSNSLVKPTGFKLAHELEQYVRKVAQAVLDALIEV